MKCIMDYCVVCPRRPHEGESGCIVNRDIFYGVELAEQDKCKCGRQRRSNLNLTMVIPWLSPAEAMKVYLRRRGYKKPRSQARTQIFSYPGVGLLGDTSKACVKVILDVIRATITLLEAPIGWILISCRWMKPLCQGLLRTHLCLYFFSFCQVTADGRESIPVSIHSQFTLTVLHE